MSKRNHISMLLCIAVVFSVSLAVAQTGIVGTKHDLSSANPNPLVTIKASSEDRICVFCHTPHNATPQTPLWNKNLNAVNYMPYVSTTMLAAPLQPNGPSRLCLSCHDGTLALGDVRESGKWDVSGQPVPISMLNVSGTGGIPSTRPSHLGISLEGDHPFSFSYYNSLPNPELSPNPMSIGLLFYGNGVMHCSTCHDPHDNTNKKFLAVNNVESGLCTLCHKMTGWDGTPHNTAVGTWNGTAPYPWPRTGAGTDFGWTTVKKNGCGNCHSPHNAAGQMRLLNCYTATGSCNPATEEGNCLPCHNGHILRNGVEPVKNIFAQLNNTSRHDVYLYTGIHDPTETAKLINVHVECVDCHNPHMANNNKTVAPPDVSGRLDGVSGISIDDASLTTAANEFEICFKCHASSSALYILPPIPRVIQEYNTRLEFQTNNPSYHPVAGAGASNDVPSLRLDISLTTSSKIYCTDCHSDDGGVSRGPHGSQYAPILKEQYKTTDDNVLYNGSNFALCYGCHYESSILSDNTFQKNAASGKGGHSGHLGAPVYAPCSVCHDPHGIRDNGVSGSHKRLINFDTRYVSGDRTFTGAGNRSGSCTLVCHGVSHDGSDTYSYPGGTGIRFRW